MASTFMDRIQRAWRRYNAARELHESSVVSEARKHQPLSSTETRKKRQLIRADLTGLPANIRLRPEAPDWAVAVDSGSPLCGGSDNGNEEPGSSSWGATLTEEPPGSQSFHSGATTTACRHST